MYLRCDVLAVYLKEHAMSKLTVHARLIVLHWIFVIALLLVGIFAIVQVQAINTSASDAMYRDLLLLKAVDESRSAQVAFKIQVQEWKNLLLRGKDQAAFDKHLAGFNKHEAEVKEHLTIANAIAIAIAKNLGIDSRLNIDSIISSFDKLGPSYREALQRYDRSAADPAAAVDKAVHGIDRAPSNSIANW